MDLKKILGATLFMWLIPVATVSIFSIKGECVEDRPDEDPYFCARERGDKKCNSSSDCCAGKECDSFGYCVRRR